MTSKSALALLLLAAAPDGSDPNTPLAQWYHNLKQPGSSASCCDLADCRPADNWRIVDGHYQVFIDKAWPAPVNDWAPVPDSAVLHHTVSQENKPVACWNPMFKAILCFIPAAGT